MGTVCYKHDHKELPVAAEMVCGCVTQERPAGVRMCAWRKGRKEMPPRKKISSRRTKDRIRLMCRTSAVTWHEQAVQKFAYIGRLP